MPRKSRIDAPGALHHIIIRGIERQPIFKHHKDYSDFLTRLGKIVGETETSCYAWALMTNHVHLLLRTGLVPISTIMRRLLTGYAQQFNRRHRRHGHLFQNRYKSFLCEEQAYLLELVRYIHLNPLRAGQVKDTKQLASHWKCGHSALMGKRVCEWQDTDYVLGLFGKTVGSARRAYAAFVNKGAGQGRRPDLVGGGLIRSAGGWSALKAIRSSGLRIMGDERILGNSDFVESVIRQANETYEKQTLALAKGLDLEAVMAVVLKHFKLDRATLTSSSRQRTVARARAIICCLAVDQLMISGREVSRELNLSASAVSKLAARGRTDDLVKAIRDEVFGSIHGPA
ncbi:MAG: transposase [Thermodesulfobacteriota bacterium]|nr:transposase [Thermodesulfobacteriota bacterium]